MSENILQLSFTDQLGIIFLLFFGRALVVAGGGTLFTQCSAWAAAHRIIPREVPWKTIRHDIRWGLLILVLDALVVAGSIHYGLLRVEELPSASRAAGTFLGMFAWMEIYFYYSHRLIHRPGLFWIHRHHHVGNLTNPWTSLSFSLAERGVLYIGSVAAPILASRLLPISLQGYSIYFLFNYILNVNGHLNVETFPRWLLRAPLLGAGMTTPTHHALHHARYKGDYGLFTRCLDRLHGTEFPDYEESFLACAAGSPERLLQPGA